MAPDSAHAHAAAVPLAHRRDIQGLRGIAVLAVTAVHAWPDSLRGGFIGVDMFFVLSGYLISAIIFSDAQAQRFTLRGFYARRVRRLFPALLAVLVASLLAAVLLTFPSQARQIGEHVAAGSLFASNIVLWSEAGYFDVSSDSKPLLHLWSLGIEEQFYILWPLAALVVLRWRRHGGWLLLALLLGSFVLNAWWVVDKAKGTFFLLPTRAWELLLGASWAWLTTAHGAPHWAAAWQRAPRVWHESLSALGLLLLTAAFLLLDKTHTFPGWWALLPTLGTLALLVAGSQTWLARRLLGQPVLVFYGGISYPLYLWHWPLLVFPQLAGVELDNATRVLMLAASVGLAALTVDFVERPLRSGAFGRLAVPALCAAMVATGLGGWALHASDGWLARMPDALQPIARADFGADFSTYRAGRCFLDLEQGPDAFHGSCASAPPAAAGLLLWGDSHAASLYAGLKPSARELMQFTKARCPPLMHTPTGASRGCAQTQAFVWNWLRLQGPQQVPHTVVLGGYWSFYTWGTGEQSLTSQVNATVRALQALGVKRVVVMGHLPTWTTPLPRLLLAEWRDFGTVPEHLLMPLDNQALVADTQLRRALAGTGAVFISPYDAFCNALGCRTMVRRDGRWVPLALDESHLTAQGSALLVDLSHARLFN
jgi:peptidoglycan/LPS O-acetylase OafA/YrhL